MYVTLNSSHPCASPDDNCCQAIPRHVSTVSNRKGGSFLATVLGVGVEAQACLQRLQAGSQFGRTLPESHFHSDFHYQYRYLACLEQIHNLLPELVHARCRLWFDR